MGSHETSKLKYLALDTRESSMGDDPLVSIIHQLEVILIGFLYNYCISNQLSPDSPNLFQKASSQF